MLKGEVIGYLGNQAEIKVINNVQYVVFSVAHNEVTKDDEGKRITNTLWVSILWKSDGGNLLQYLTKGQHVFVRGNISPRMYMSADGSAKVGLTMFCREIQLIGGQKPEEPANPSSGGHYATQAEIANGIIQDRCALDPDSNNVPFDI